MTTKFKVRAELKWENAIFWLGYYLTPNLCEIYTGFAKTPDGTIWYVADDYNFPDVFQRFDTKKYK